jgi:hypothetical protein
VSLPRGVGAAGARWLYSEHFLTERLPEWPEFSTLDTTQLHADLRSLWAAERATLVGANEGETEQRFVRPVLERLGHSFALFQPIPGTGRVPDYL